MRTFDFETRNGATMGTVEARNVDDAMVRAQKRFKEPTAGWRTVRISIRLTDEVLAMLVHGKEIVHAAVRENPGIDCPEGCAARAMLAQKGQDYALSAAWWERASAVSAGQSRAAMYDEYREKCLKRLDPDWTIYRN